MDQSSLEHMKGVIESLLFVNERPITFNQIKGVLEGIETNDIKQAIKLLIDEYADRKSGMIIAEIAGGYQMLTNSTYAAYIRSFYKTKHKEKLSKPALETLAIVAYKQPVTRLDVELIRGVNSDGVMAHLFRKELIKIVGRKDVPGRPYLYGTTKQFLEYFGLKSLADLPNIEDFPKLEAAVELTQEGETPEELPASEEGLESVQEIEARQETLEQEQEQETELPAEDVPVEQELPAADKEQEILAQEDIPDSVIDTSSNEEPEEEKNINQTFEEDVSSSDTAEMRTENESCETSQKDQ